MIDFSDIACPKCNKRYFKVRNFSEYSPFNLFPLVLKHSKEPIYKDGVLINPKESEFEKQYFQCLECGCHFRTEDNGKVWRTVDEDKEHQDWLNRINEQSNVNKKKDQEENINAKSTISSRLTVNNPTDNAVSLVIDDKYATKADVEKLEKLINEMQEEMNKRFRKLEASEKSD